MKPLLYGAASFVAAVATAWSASHAQPPQTPVFRQRVDVVEIDTTVVDRDGSHVDDLTAEDFVVTVDNAPRRIVSFRLSRTVTPDKRSSSRPAPALSSEAGRTIVLVIDRDSIPPQAGRSFIDGAVRFVRSLPPADRVAVWTLPVGSNALQFLEDRAELERRIRQSVGTSALSTNPVLMTPDEAVKIEFFHDRTVRDEVVDRECGVARDR
jgi:VWFA-related protein